MDAINVGPDEINPVNVTLPIDVELIAGGVSSAEGDRSLVVDAGQSAWHGRLLSGLRLTAYLAVRGEHVVEDVRKWFSGTYVEIRALGERVPGPVTVIERPTITQFDFRMFWPVLLVLPVALAIALVKRRAGGTGLAPPSVAIDTGPETGSDDEGVD